MKKRTTDTSYGRDYFETLDNGLGYQDSTLWEDIAHTIKEVFAIRDARDAAGEVNVLDVGCAKGFLVRHLRRRGFDAWGVDFSQYALSRAPQEIAEYLTRFDLTHTQVLPWGPFALVVCLETLEHIPEESVNQTLNHIYTALKPDGLALFTVCVAEQPDTESDPTHVTIRPRTWWLERFGDRFVSQPEAEERLRTFWLFSQHQGVFVLQKR